MNFNHRTVKDVQIYPRKSPRSLNTAASPSTASEKELRSKPSTSGKPHEEPQKEEEEGKRAARNQRGVAAPLARDLTVTSSSANPVLPPPPRPPATHQRLSLAEGQSHIQSRQELHSSGHWLRLKPNRRLAPKPPGGRGLSGLQSLSSSLRSAADSLSTADPALPASSQGNYLRCSHI